MVLLFVLLMAVRYTGATVHEWLSLLLVVSAAVHLRLNAGWWRALPKLMRMRPGRTLATLAAAGFLAAALISGIPLSEHLSALTGWRTDLSGRSLHMFLAHWGFLLAAVHLGLCGKGTAAGMLRVVPRRMLPCLAAVLLAFALYGAHAFAARELVLPLTMKTSFTVWNEEDHLFRLLADYLAVFCLAASGTGVVSHLLRRASERFVLPPMPSGTVRERAWAEPGRKLR